jgi:hypothetical protein
MNSGLTGALGTAPLQTVKVRLGSFQGRSHTQIPLERRGSVFFGDPRLSKTGEESFSAPKGTASGLRSFAGPMAVASGSYSVAFGGEVGAFTGTASSTNAFAFAGTASGTDSCCLGRGSTSTQARSFAFGHTSNATAADAYAIGQTALADRAGVMAFGTGRFSNTGDAQSLLTNARITTSSTTPTTATLAIPTNKAISGRVIVVAKQTSSANVCRYTVEFLAVNASGTSSLQWSSVVADHEDTPSADLTIGVNDATDSIELTWTAPDANTWRVCAQIFAAEVL